MTERSSIFDMIGPVMIGPSSSHTAGVVRIGRVARRILGAKPETVLVTFYNSFATTFEGHGSDRAVLAGLLDYATDDPKIKEALQIATEQNINFTFKPVISQAMPHPNTVRIKAATNQKEVEIIGISRGGGLISIIEVNHFSSNFTAQLHTLIIFADDIKGSIAFITDIIAHDDCNIATMTVTRKAKNNLASLILEMDSGLKPTTIAYLKNLSWVKEVIYFPDIDTPYNPV